jgi:hypothetical protein
MRNKTVNVTYQRRNVKGIFGKSKPKLVRVKKTVTKTSAKGKSDLDIIAGMKGKEQGKALRNRQLNRTLQSLELGSSTLGGMSSIGKNLANAINYKPTTTPTNNTAAQNINGGIQTSQSGRDDDEENTEGRGVA